MATMVPSLDRETEPPDESPAAAPSSAAPAGVTLALEMQAAIAEETNDAASAAERQALVDALVPRLTDVLGTAERVS